jgi:hypothetical protein
MLRHRIWYALALSALLVLGRGAVALAHANTDWNPAFSDPAHVNISDIGGLIAKTVLYSDPTDDVRRALLVVLRPAGRVALASAMVMDDAFPRAYSPRAPPAA